MNRWEMMVVFFIILALLLSAIYSRSLKTSNQISQVAGAVAVVTPQTLMAEKTTGELKKAEDPTGVTTDLGWKFVMPSSIRWDDLAQMYQIRYGAGGQGKDGRLWDIRTAWVSLKVLDPDRGETSCLIKLWEGRKDLKAHIVSRVALGELNNTSYIATEIK